MCFCIKSLDHSISQKSCAINHSIQWITCFDRAVTRIWMTPWDKYAQPRGSWRPGRKSLPLCLRWKWVTYHLYTLHNNQVLGGWVVYWNCPVYLFFSVCFCLSLCPRLVWTISFELLVILSWFCAVNRVLKSKNLPTYWTVHPSWTNLGMVCWSFYKGRLEDCFNQS